MSERLPDFADIPPITDFDSCQKARPLILQSFASLLGVWQVCSNRGCARARRCQGHGAPCLPGFMQAIPEADRQEIRSVVKSTAQGRPAA